MEGATQGTARLLVERLAQAAQAAAPLDWDNPLAEAFCMLRLEPRGNAYGAFHAVVDTRSIIDRAMPCERH
jgi:putative acyl-CoA dehydrogenase